MGSRYGLQIRSAAPVDASDIAILLGTAGAVVSPASVEAGLERVRRAGVVLLASEWGPPSGLIAVTWSASLLDAAVVARIDVLFVAPGDRRRGIGRLLLKAGSQAARSAGCADLRVEASMGCDALEAFCLSTGFHQAGRTLARHLRKRA